MNKCERAREKSRCVCLRVSKRANTEHDSGVRERARTRELQQSKR